MMIGRDATDQQLARLNDMMNVSRRHATIGLAPHGAWIRDENSTNGTFVNGRPVKAGETADLAEGAELRLASDVRATVRFRRPRRTRDMSDLLVAATVLTHNGGRRSANEDAVVVGSCTFT